MPAPARPSLSAAIGLALGTVLLVASSAVAGTPAMGVNGGPGVPCFGIESSGSVAVSVTQKRAGSAIASTSFVPATDGTQVCLKPLKAGDKLIIQQGATQRTATVPSITGALDVAGDKVTGTTSLIGKTVSVEVVEQLGGIGTGAFVSGTVGPVGVNGGFSKATTPTLDLQRGDVARFNILTDTDDWQYRISSGSMVVQVGSASASGTVALGAQAKAVLKSPSGTVRGRFSVRSGRDMLTGGRFTATFRKNGKAVKVRAGDRITFSGSPKTFTVPAPTMTVNTAGGGSLSATCPVGGDWVAFVDALRVGTDHTTPTSAVSVPDLSGLTSGERVRLACSNKAAWVVMQEFLVP